MIYGAPRTKAILLCIIITLLAGCASHHAPEVYADPYGFFFGLWHGFITPLTILVNVISWLLSLLSVSFLNEIEIIGRPNTGIFYYLGYVIGLCTILSN